MRQGMAVTRPDVRAQIAIDCDAGKDYAHLWFLEWDGQIIRRLSLITFPYIQILPAANMNGGSTWAW